VSRGEASVTTGRYVQRGPVLPHRDGETAPPDS
jgi:hypothetical protein